LKEPTNGSHLTSISLCRMRTLPCIHSFAKEPYERGYILQKRPVILRSLLIVTIPHPFRFVACAPSLAFTLFLSSSLFRFFFLSLFLSLSFCRSLSPSLSFCLSLSLSLSLIQHVHAYEESWFLNPRFGGGIALFMTGMWMNMMSDEILRSSVLQCVAVCVL